MRKWPLALVMVAALAASGCNTNSSSETADQVVAAIQKACGYTTTAQQIEAIAIAIASQVGVSPASVSAASITLAIANKVVDNVCAAVTAQTTNQLLAAGPNKVVLGSDGSRTVTVVVDGVTVVGLWTPPKK